MRVIALALALLLTLPALAQQPGADAHIAPLVRLYQAQKVLTASKGLYELLEDDTFPTEASRIHYYLGMCLWELELYHSAQHHLVEVARRGPRDPYFRYAVPRLASIAEHTGDSSDLARLAEALEPDQVPPRAAARFAWLRGLQRVDEGDLTGAVRELRQVPADDPLYLRARYTEGAVQYERGRLKSAVLAFNDVYTAELHPRSHEEAGRLEELQDLALVATARTHFAVGNHDKADDLYSRVHRESRWWPVAWSERAWARFHVNDINRTLGLILAVDSPYFEDELLPEAAWLAALSWFQLCEWDQAWNTLLSLEADLEPRLAITRGLVERYLEPGAPLDVAWEEVWSEETGLDDKTLTRLVRQREVDGLVTHLALLEGEEARIQGTKLAWRDGVGTHLLAVIERDRQRLEERAGAAAIEELGRQAAELEDLAARSRLLRFEIVDAERLRWETMDPIVEPEDASPGQFATSRDTVYWPWNGEFWEDELPWYRYGQQSQCRAH